MFNCDKIRVSDLCNTVKNSMLTYRMGRNISHNMSIRRCDNMMMGMMCMMGMCMMMRAQKRSLAS